MSSRKTIRTDTPALIRLAEFGFKQPCGHHAFEWSDRIRACLGCVREQRVHPPHWTVAWFNAMPPDERKALIEEWRKELERRGL